MARTRILPAGIQELIKWRWDQRPTIKSLSEEYGVSRSNISDIIHPELRKRRSKKYKETQKKDTHQPLEPTQPQHFTRQGKVVHWKA